MPVMDGTCSVRHIKLARDVKKKIPYDETLEHNVIIETYYEIPDNEAMARFQSDFSDFPTNEDHLCDSSRAPKKQN